MKVTASLPKKDENGNRIKDAEGNVQKESATVEYPIGDTLEENRKSHGDEVVNRLFVAKAKIEVQDMVRRMLAQGKSQKEIQDAASKFILGQKQTAKKSQAEKAKELYAKMSPEEQKEFLKELKAKNA
jgi:hypothetical protein